MIRVTTDVENGRGSSPTGFGILLAECDELLGQPLCFLGLVPGGRDGFVLKERCDEIPEHGLSMGRAPAEVPVLHMASRHGCTRCDGPSVLSSVQDDETPRK